MNVSLRNAVPGDLLFARHVYYQTQRWLIEHYFGWDEAQEDELFSRQFDAEKSSIVVIDGDDAGWLQIHEDDEKVEIEGLYILEAYQGRGIGTHLITSIIDDAAAKRKDVTLSTAKASPAKTLYERLGFKITREEERKYYLQRAYNFTPV